MPPMMNQFQFMMTIEEQLRLSQEKLHKAEVELMRLEHELQIKTLVLQMTQERSHAQESEIAELKIKIERERALKDSLHYHLIVGGLIMKK